MTLQVEVGQFTKDSSGTNGATQNISTGFNPKAVIVWGTHLQTSNGLGDGNVAFSYGFSDGSNNVCNGSDGEDGVGTEVSQSTIRNDSCIFFGTVSGGGTDASATISFGTNQFTVTWDINNTTATIINYIVLGGDDITGVQAGTFTKTTSGAPVTQNVTIDSDVQNITNGYGAVFFMSPDHDVLNNMVGDLDIGLGIAVPSSTNEGVYHVSNDNGMAVSETFQTYSESKCMRITDADSGVLQAEADLTNVNSTMNITWTTNDAQASQIAFLLIKGGRWQIGNETALTVGSTKDTTTNFTPKGLITVAGRRTTEGTTNQTFSHVVGARANSTEIAGGFSELDSNTTMFYGRTLSNTKAIQILDQGAGAPTVDGEADASFGTNKFTMDWTDLASSAWKFLWVVMGDTPTKTFTCDAILIKRKEFTCDAILKATFTETFTIDARLSALEEFTCDSLLKTTNNFNFTVDALIEAEVMEFFLIDAFLEQTFDETFTIDAILRGVSITVDAQILRRFDEEFSVDTLLKKTQDETFLIDGLLEDTFDETFTIDARLRARFDETFTIDALRRKTLTKTFTVDARKKKVFTKTYTIDARLSKIKTFKTDGLVIKAIQFKVDGLSQATIDETFTIDGLLSQSSILFSIDSILIVRNTLDFTIDSRLRDVIDEEFLVDSLLEKALDEVFLIDSLLETTNTEVFDVDAILRARFNKTFTVDVYIEKTQTKTFLIDGLLEDTFIETFIVDGLKEDTFDEVFSVDSILVNRFDETFIVDAYVRATQNFNFTVDGLPFTPPAVLITIDAEIIISGIESFTVDGRIKLVSTLTPTCDSILKATFTETFTCDAVTYLPIYKPFSIDALLEKIRTKTFIIDARLKQAKTKTFLVDSILVLSGVPVKNFLIDARLKKVQTKVFTIQARLRFVKTKSYTVDGLLKMSGDTLCSVLTPIFSDDFNVSTGWTQSGTITVDSISHPDVLRFSSTGSGTASQAIKTLPIPTGEEFRIEFTHKNIGNINNGFGAYGSFGLTTITTRIGAQFDIVPKLEYRITANEGPDGEGITILYRSTISDPFLTSASIPMNDNTTYYVRIDKNLASIITLSMFSDPARTIHVSGSPIQLDVSSQIKVPFTFVQASNVGPPGPGSARLYTGEIEDLVIYEDRCPNFLINAILQKEQEKTFIIDAKLATSFEFKADALLSKAKLKTFKVDAFFDASIQGTFDVDAYLVTVFKFTADAILKAIGDDRCPFENIFEEHFTTTSGWSAEINNTTVDGWGAQRIFIDGESSSSQELDQFGNINGFARIQMPPGGFNPFQTPILKSKYRRKRLDFNGGIGRVRGNNIRMDFEFTPLSAGGGRYIVLNKSGSHPDNDPNTSTLNINSVGGPGLSVTLDDGINSATTGTVIINVGTKRFVVVESLGNTLTLNVYTDEAHTTHASGSPKIVNTASVNKEQLDFFWLIIGANNKGSGPANPTPLGIVDKIKIFSSPCPVAYVDAHIENFFGREFTIDALLNRERRFTIDVIIQGRKYPTVDAILVKSLQFTLDTHLSKRFNSLFTIDPLLLGAINKTFKIDGIRFVVPAELISIDAILNLSGRIKTFIVDALIQNIPTEASPAIFSLTHLQDITHMFNQIEGKTFIVDARTFVRKTKTLFVDAIIKRLGQNGTCNFYPYPFFAIDTGLEQYVGPITPDHEQSVDLFIGQEIILNNQQVRSVTFLLRATGFPNEITDSSPIAGKIWSNVVIGNSAGEITEATSENTINAQNTSGDLPPGVWKQITFTYDRDTTPFLTGNFVVGFQHFVGANTNDPKGVGTALPVISNSNVILGSAVTRREGNSVIDPLTWQYLTSMSKDIVVRVEVVNGNDIIEGVGKQCPVVDANIRGPFSKLFTVDAITDDFKQLTTQIDAFIIPRKEFTIDAILTALKPKVDAILIPSPVVSKVDGILLVTPGNTFGLDALLKKTQNKTFTVDSRLSQDNINKVFNCNALLFKLRTKTFTIDARPKFINKLSPFKVDGIVIKFPSALIFVDGRVKKFGAQKLFRIDALLEKTKLFNFSIDGRLNKLGSKIFDVDTRLVIKNKNKTFTIRAMLSVTQPPKFFTVDAFIGLRNARWRADSLLKARKTKVPNIDARIASRLVKTYTIDGIVKQFGITHTTKSDAIVKALNQFKTFIVDTFSEQSQIKTFTVDARTVFPFKKPLVDAKVVNRRTKTFTVDSFIDPPFTQKPKIDAIVKAFGLIEPFTVDARVGIGETTASIDAILNKRKTFSIDAFVGELIDIGIEAESVISEGSGDIGFESTVGIGGT